MRGISTWALEEPKSAPLTSFSYMVSSKSDMSALVSSGCATEVTTTRPFLPTMLSAWRT